MQQKIDKCLKQTFSDIWKIMKWGKNPFIFFLASIWGFSFKMAVKVADLKCWHTIISWKHNLHSRVIQILFAGIYYKVIPFFVLDIPCLQISLRSENRCGMYHKTGWIRYERNQRVWGPKGPISLLIFFTLNCMRRNYHSLIRKCAYK